MIDPATTISKVWFKVADGDATNFKGNGNYMTVDFDGAGYMYAFSNQVSADNYAIRQYDLSTGLYT